ncbi:MAG: DUF2075 domain-containing protein [Thermosediminibacteraceae bacterium]|nr:DUF2075 domain-containing protein [Thermosediminibacteraceae bacterium]
MLKEEVYGLVEYAYSGSVKDFGSKNVNALLNEIVDNFKSVFRLKPNESEIAAWEDLIPKLQEIVKVLPPDLDDLHIFIELRMPFSSARADAFLLGKKGGKFTGVIIEHKQWSDSSIMVSNGNFYVLGKEVLNPYLQAEGYALYLKDYVEILHDGEVKYLAFLPNLKNVDVLKQSGTELIYGNGQEDDLSNFLIDVFDYGLSQQDLEAFLNSRYSPSKTLVNQVTKAINNEDSWVLIDEQKLVFEKLKGFIESLKSGTFEKKVVIVKGGPGTGKSALAMQLLGHAMANNISAVHVTNSKAFTTTVKGIILQCGKFRQNRLNGLFKQSHNFINAKKDSIDLAVCDEAHRFRKSTNFRFCRSNESQIYQIIRSSKVSVFFIDERQIVRPGEDGTKEHIKQQAQRNGARVFEYKLMVQFRNAGNEYFVKWLDYILGIKKEPVDCSLWMKDFELKIFDDINELEEKLSEKIKEGFSSRIVAGFCWPWNDPDPEGNLPQDVVINEWRKAWNRKGSGRNIRPDEDPYYEWATRSKNQLNEVGCIYSVQGFEFDYIGVIWGEDLVFRKGWVAQPNKSYDTLIQKKKAAEVLDLLKNTYRTLLSRGMKGCYVYFMDEETREFFKSKLVVDNITRETP